MLVDEATARAIFSVENAAWTATLLLLLFLVRIWNGAPAMFEQWITYRKSLAEEKTADWRRLREEITRLSQSEVQCRAEYVSLHNKYLEVLQRVSQLEGFMAGQGQAAQQAAGIVAIERLNNGDENGK